VRCTSPYNVGFKTDGKTLSWSPKEHSREFATFQIPCGKCLSCRLESARQTAIRCVHEAQMYEKNSFITLTYSDENLKSPRLIYNDFQLFIKKLRSRIFSDYLNKLYPDLNQKAQRKLFNSLTKESKDEHLQKIRISVFVAGEYGDIGKRPHWHAIIFNWRPDDEQYKYSNHRGDRVFTSQLLDETWGKGITEIGSVTFESAGYCARYATKKLYHGKDGEHEFNPISKRSSKYAIGKKWIEKYWSDVFSYGYIILNGDIKTSIPRYYEKWFQKHHPEKWIHYVTQLKPKIVESAIEKEKKITIEEKKFSIIRGRNIGLKNKRLKDKNKILEIKFKENKKHLKI